MASSDEMTSRPMCPTFARCLQIQFPNCFPLGTRNPPLPRLTCRHKTRRPFRGRRRSSDSRAAPPPPHRRTRRAPGRGTSVPIVTVSYQLCPFLPYLVEDGAQAVDLLGGGERRIACVHGLLRVGHGLADRLRLLHLNASTDFLLRGLPRIDYSMPALYEMLAVKHGID